MERLAGLGGTGAGNRVSHQPLSPSSPSAAVPTLRAGACVPSQYGYGLIHRPLLPPRLRRSEKEDEGEDDEGTIDVVDNFLTPEHFFCYPLEEDEIQPPQSSDDDWLWSPATGWQRAREVDAESVAA